MAPTGPAALVTSRVSPSLAWQSPDWLKDGQRPPDVSERMGWFPLVTFWQVALDLPGAGAVPEGFGHMYSKRANTEAWVAVTQPEGWTAEPTPIAALEPVLAAAPLGAELTSPHAVNLLRAENLSLTAMLDAARAELEALRAELATIRAGATRKRVKADAPPADPAPPAPAPDANTDDFVPPSVDPDAP